MVTHSSVAVSPYHPKFTGKHATRSRDPTRSRDQVTAHPTHSDPPQLHALPHPAATNRIVSEAYSA
eukprot:478480-Rhodomonas_salina.1